MYPSIYQIRFLFLFLLIFVLFLSSLTKSKVKEGAANPIINKNVMFNNIKDASIRPPVGVTASLITTTPIRTTTPVITTMAPVEEPVEEPTEEPTEEPLEEPTEEPLEEPVEEPTTMPTTMPTTRITTRITTMPTTRTTTRITTMPTTMPTTKTTTMPTTMPTTKTTTKTTGIPTTDVFMKKSTDIYTKPTNNLFESDYNPFIKTPKSTRDMFLKDYSNPTNQLPTSKNKYRRDISQDINIEYHKSEDQLRKELGQPLEMTYIYDKDGNKILYPSPKIQGNITYHVPGSYPFGSINYVPKYADSILLSKSTGLSTETTIQNTAEMMGGFCSYYKNNPDKLEEYCKSTNVNKCASTNCCVLLGGSNCVAGKEKGPTNKAHYNDIYIRNKDYYYYQGKCYGNCI